MVGGDDSILFPAVAGFHDAVSGTLGIVHLDAHLDLLDESPAQGRFSQSSGMRRALELPRVRARHSVQVGTRSFNFPSSKRFIDEVGLTELPATLVARRGFDWTLARIREVVAGADHVFLAWTSTSSTPPMRRGRLARAGRAHQPGPSRPGRRAWRPPCAASR